jgi:hypothetical protein
MWYSNLENTFISRHIVNIDTLVPSFCQCVETRSVEAFWLLSQSIILYYSILLHFSLSVDLFFTLSRATWCSIKCIKSYLLQIISHHQVLKLLREETAVFSCRLMSLIYKSLRCACVFDLVGCILPCCVLCWMSCFRMHLVGYHLRLANVLEIISQPSYEPLYTTNSSHRKQKIFIYEYSLHWALLSTKNSQQNAAFR